MSSRLQRLLQLLDIGSNPAIRSQAAQQIGELQRDHPDQIHVLLQQLQPYLQSNQWTTRIAAAHALELMCNEMRTQLQERVEGQSESTASMESSSAASAAVAAVSSPAVAAASSSSSSATASSSSSSHLLMHLAGFSVESVIRKGTLMLADAPSPVPSAANAASSSSFAAAAAGPAPTLSQRVARQRQELLKRLGLYEEFGGVYESFGGVDALLQESDLEPSVAAASLTSVAPASTPTHSAIPAAASASGGRVLSARELNKAARDAKAHSKRKREEQEQRDRDAIEAASAAPSSLLQQSQQRSEKRARLDVQSISTSGSADAAPSAVILESLPAAAAALSDPAFALVLPDGSHVLLPFVKRLLWEMLDLQWERRHGAAIALRSVMKSQAPWIGCDLRPSLTRDQQAASSRAHAQFLSDCCARLLCVLILDRFADFSDSGCSMVAPVRESTAQILAILGAQLGADDMRSLAHCLTQIADHPEAEPRFGAFLALKYVLAVRFSSADAMIVAEPSSLSPAAAASSTAERAEVNVAVLTLVLPPLIGALRDPSDDVRSMAADSLSAILHAIPTARADATQRLLPMHQLQALVAALWSSLALCDDLTSSTANVFQLLCQLHEWIDRTGLGDEALASCPLLSALLQSLYPFLSHSVLSVRLHVWRTIRTLLRVTVAKSNSSGAAPLSTEQLSLVIRLAFQSTLLESDEALLQTCAEVVALCCPYASTDLARAQFLVLFDSVAPLCMQLMFASLFQPLPKQLLLRWECLPLSSAGAAVTAVPWTSDEHCSLEMKLRGSKLVGSLLFRLVRVTEASSAKAQLHPQIQSLLAHLSSPHDLFVQVACFILCEWWTLSISQMHQLSSVALCFERSPQWLTALAPLIDPTLPNRPRSANTNALLCQTAIQACVIAGDDVDSNRKQLLLRSCTQPLLFTLEHEAKYPPLQQRCAFYLSLTLQQWVAPRGIKLEEQDAREIDEDRSAADALASKLVDMLCATIPAPQWRVDAAPLSAAAAVPSIKAQTIVKSEVKPEPSSDASMDESDLLALLQAEDEADAKTAAAAPARAAAPAAGAVAEPAAKKQRKSKKLKQADAATITAAGSFASADTVASAALVAERGASLFFTALCARFHAADAGIFECFPRLWDEEIAAPLATLMRQQQGASKEKEDRCALCRALQLLLHLMPNLAPLKQASVETRLLQLLPSIYACLVLAPSTAVATAPSASTASPDASSLLPLLTRRVLVLFVQHYTAASMASLIQRVLPTLIALDPSLLGAEVVPRKLAVLELVSSVLSDLRVSLLLPYLPFVIQPVLTCMSDASTLTLSAEADPSRLVRERASSVFAQMMPLLPLEAGTAADLPADMDASLVALRSERRAFLRELVDGSRGSDADAADESHSLLPAGVLASGVVLRRYQRDGIRWLRFLHRFSLHGILCDEMGLGKTSQALLLMASTIQERRNALRAASLVAASSSAAFSASAVAAQFHPLPSLVICPATLMHHWRAEFGKFVDPAGCPLRVALYEGSAAQKMELRDRIAAAAAAVSPSAAVNPIDRDSVLIMSYDSARRDAPLFRNIAFLHLTLDEGHLLRNPASALSRSIKSIRSVHRLILSGTPLSNHAVELWSLFDFLMPNYLRSEKQFAKQFANPIQKARKAEVERDTRKERNGNSDELDSKTSAVTVTGNLALESLHKRVLPLMLRRLKSDVLRDLPPKIVQDVLVDLSPLQSRLYALVIKQREEQIAVTMERRGEGALAKQQKDADERQQQQQQQQHTFQSLQYLRKLCTHPCLVWSADHPAHAAIQSEFFSTSASAHLRSHAPPSVRSLVHAPKLRALRDLLLQCGIGATSTSVSSMAQGSVDVDSLLTAEKKMTHKRKQHSGSASAAAVSSSSSASSSAASITSLDSILSAHRVLVFAQLISTLDLVESLLLNRPDSASDDAEDEEDQECFLPGSVSYLRLDGSVPASKRGALVSQFNSDPSIDLMLLTTSVGGLGLNLSTADTVILLEHDFDPQRDLQAMDRAHRLGQSRPVNVYRLICRASLEERIMGLQAFKLHVANTVINEANASISTMDTSAVVDRLAETAAAGSAAAATNDDAAAASAMDDDSATASDAAASSYGDEYDVSSFLRSLQSS